MAEAIRRGYGEDGIYFDHRGGCRDSAHHKNEFSVAAVSRRECRRPTADPVVRIGRVEFAEDRG